MKGAYLETEDAIQRETQASRNEAEREAMALGGGKEVRMIKDTVYLNDDRLNCMREMDIPSAMIFEPLGWDREPGVTKEKHYRKFYTDGLENTKAVMSKPSEFMCYNLKRGQSRGAKKSMFSFGAEKADASGEQDTT